jgi:RNA polymerase sigma-70 factor (ECF subfamily)
MHTTPPSLLERLRRPGDRQAWDRFVELYAPLIYFWACRTGLQAEDAADLAQDVFAALLEKMPGFVYDPGKSFRAWLRTLVLNRWRDRRRRDTAAVRRVEAAPLDEVPAPEVEGFWEEEHRRHLAAHALRLMQAEFQPSTWQACWEVVARGRAPAAVAAEMGLSLAAVYTARSRVLRRLRQEMAGLLD